MNRRALIAIDQAGDFFRDTYRGRMVNLWGLVPVIRGWGRALGGLSDAEKRKKASRCTPAWMSTA